MSEQLHAVASKLLKGGWGTTCGHLSWAVYPAISHPNSVAIVPLLMPLPIDVSPGLHYPCNRRALYAEAATRAKGGTGSQPEITKSRCLDHEPQQYRQFHLGCSQPHTRHVQAGQIPGRSPAVDRAAALGLCVGAN